MRNALSPLRPPVLLAITYAPVAARARLTWLMALDQRFADVLSRTTEPLIAQLRLSWWRDALNSEPVNRPKGEPLLADLNDFKCNEDLIFAGLRLVDAFEVLATNYDLREQKTAQAQRILAICGAYAQWVGGAESQRGHIEQIASWWASADSKLPKSWTRILRPLSIIALAEKLERRKDTASSVNQGLRLNWHALTGR